MEDPRPRTGIGVMVIKEGKVLLGKRKGSHGGGEYAFPGGHLEHMESFAECGQRETQEEAGIEIENIRFLFLGNLKDYPPKHYTHIQLVADWKAGEPKVMEPDKCEGWEWYPLDAIPKPCFSMIPLALESYKTGKNYFDA
jgi:8-oxo-dGTP diphosphatase